MTQLVTFRAVIPENHWLALDTLMNAVRAAVTHMLEDRSASSTSCYTNIPSVVAKALIRKYQRNNRCRNVERIVIPICGDKGRQVKIDSDGLRVPAIFKKEVIPVRFHSPVYGHIRCVELFKRHGRWFISYSYNTPCAIRFTPTNVIGVDRNSVGNIAAIADPRSGVVRMVGFNADRWKSNFRARKARILSQGRKRLASRLRLKQCCRTRYEDHRASKTIVDYAARHRSAISLEKLNLKKGAKSYADRRQWAHAQLQEMIQYKAALRGVSLLFVNPAYTSQDCSRCGSRNKPEGKSYRCTTCGHKTHRDANSAFNIAFRGIAVLSDGNGDGLNVPASGSVGGPLSGKGVC